MSLKLLDAKVLRWALIIFGIGGIGLILYSLIKPRSDALNLLSASSTYAVVLVTLIYAMITSEQRDLMMNQLEEMKRDREMFAKSVRGDVYQGIIEEASSIDRLVIDHPHLAKLWGSIEYGRSDGDPNEVRQAYAAIMMMNFYENIYFQHEQGNIPDAIWESWKLHMINVFCNGEIKEQWNNAKSVYYKPFRIFVDETIVEKRQDCIVSKKL